MNDKNGDGELRAGHKCPYALAVHKDSFRCTRADGHSGEHSIEIAFEPAPHHEPPMIRVRNSDFGAALSWAGVVEKRQRLILARQQVSELEERVSLEAPRAD